MFHVKREHLQISKVSPSSSRWFIKRCSDCIELNYEFTSPGFQKPDADFTCRPGLIRLMGKKCESAIAVYRENYSEIKTELHELRNSWLLLWRFCSWPSIQGSSTF